MKLDIDGFCSIKRKHEGVIVNSNDVEDELTETVWLWNLQANITSITSDVTILGALEPLMRLSFLTWVLFTQAHSFYPCSSALFHLFHYVYVLFYLMW